jgi:hypothetical protein
MTSGIAAFLVGQWKAAADRSAEAEEILLTRCTGVTWELTNARAFLLGSLLYMGELRQIAQRIPALLASAHDQGNLYAATEIQTRFNLVWLVMDDPARAASEVQTAVARWSQNGFHRQHYNSMLGLAQVDLYSGVPQTAWTRVLQAWPALSRSLLLRIQVLRVEAHYIRGRCALATAWDTPDHSTQVREAERAAARITRERMAWSDSFAHVLRGGAAALRGDVPGARAQLEAAVAGFEQSDMRLYGAAAKRALGLITPGGQGQALIGSADEWMQQQGIRNPARFGEMLAPGFQAAARRAGTHPAGGDAGPRRSLS